MATLYTLPDELLLYVALASCPEDLFRLCLTSKEILPLAQEALFHSIYIPPAPSRRQSRLALLRRTLLEQPYLSRHIRGLNLEPRQWHVMGDYLRPRVEVPENTLPPILGFDAAMYEPKIAVTIITRSPNLETLTWKLSPCRNFHHRDPTDNRDLSTLRGFQNVKSLTLDRNDLEPHWSKLPRLKHLNLDAEFCRLHSPLAGEYNGVEVLEIRAGASWFVHASRERYSADMEKFLRLFPKLKEFRALCKDLLSWPMTFPSIQYSFDNFIDKLEPVRSNLEVLDIGAFEELDEGFISSIGYLPWLRSFPRLHTLVIPESFLPRDSEGRVRLVPERFPPSIKTIRHQNGQNVVVAWPERSNEGESLAH